MTDYIIDLFTLFDVKNEIWDAIKKAEKYFEIKLDYIKPNENIYYLEELSYKGRIFIASNLTLNDTYIILNKYNVDAFITKVVSAEEAKAFTTNANFYKYMKRFTNANSVFITRAKEVIEVAMNAGFKVILIGNGSRLSSLKDLLNHTSNHRIDTTMGDSSIRCV
ncbi:MAG: hypothetical protein JZD40_00375 [Sulfolobus sp.]|nr:hypothetical protein [Sulfolobus sp.]